MRIISALVLVLAGPIAGVAAVPRRWATPSARTAVLCHGFHLGAADWEEVVVGEAGCLGRATYAALVAVGEGAVCVVFGSGGSRTAGGECEGDVTLRVLKERLRQGILGNEDATVAVLRHLDAVAVAETASRNTWEELAAVIPVLVAHRIDKLVLVSSPAHIPRCVRDAHLALRPHLPHLAIHAAPCETSFTPTAHVAIVEPPHRGDRDPALDPDPPLHSIARRMLGLRPEARIAFAHQANLILNHLDGDCGDDPPPPPPPS